jgi:hypothetical protein
MKSVFFWSEEHAREYRREHTEVRGSYMTLAQSVFLTPRVQGAIFGLPRKKGEGINFQTSKT